MCLCISTVSLHGRRLQVCVYVYLPYLCMGGAFRYVPMYIYRISAWAAPSGLRLCIRSCRMSIVARGRTDECTFVCMHIGLNLWGAILQDARRPPSFYGNHLPYLAGRTTRSRTRCSFYVALITTAHLARAGAVYSARTSTVAGSVSRLLQRTSTVDSSVSYG